MLLTKTSKIKWNPANKDWYISKGYIFTKYNNEFKVNVEDLPRGSHANVKVKCDACGKINSSVNWKIYINHLKDNKKYYCRECSHSKKFISFAQWGIDNICKNFLEKYWDWEKNNELDIDPWKIRYGSNKKVYIFCQNKQYHNSYETICNSFVRGSRCPYCSSSDGKIHPKDSLGQYIIDNYGKEFLNKIWSEKNKKSPFEYMPHSEKEVWFKCPDNKHKDYYRDIKESNYSCFRCPKCVNEMDESIIQNKTRLYLESLGYNVLHEFNCTLIPINPRTNQKLPFDNEVTLVNSKKLIIEVMGEQHYKIGGWHKKRAKKFKTTPEYELHYQKLKDRYKRFISYKRSYTYLEIPYTVFDNNDTYKILINNKINQILNNKCLNYNIIQGNQTQNTYAI